jgi:opacity protein-like surface antigen
MRLNLLAGACAASMLLALTPTVQAADIDVAPEPMGLSWYVSVFGGWSLPKDESFFFEDTANSVEVDGDINLDSGFMAGLAVGAHFSEWARAELEVSGNWHDAGGDVEADEPTSTDTFEVSGEEDALFVMANLWIDLPVGEVIRPYVGGGLGFGRLDVDLIGEETNGSTDVIIDDSDWGFAYQLGAGVAFGFTPNMAIDVGYRYKVINNADLQLSDDITDDNGGQIEKDYKSHNILVGLRFGF